MDVVNKSSRMKKRRVEDPKVRWWSLTTENANTLSGKIKADGSWKKVVDANTMWEAMSEYIRRSTKKVLGISRGGGGRIKGARW